MGKRDVEYLYYQIPRSVDRALRLPEGYEFRWFRPALRTPLPSLGGIHPFGVWFLFSCLGIFPRGSYRVLEIFRGDTSVHRSCVFPRYYRFPFMKPDDLQVGDIWTDPACRGKGLAGAALQLIVRELSRPGRDLWYLVEPANTSSIRVAEKIGLRRVARGRRIPRFGVGLLGQFVIDEWREDRDPEGRE